ncbi:flagellar hook-associated protein [Arthrobacter sp. CAU 1506]|uniref:flagellar filament capping protein FliD n=1 Tax=Arthrobacter sp. CAU 1506 TaxID=2560052 RepID=UPI0010AD5DF8|nr:flagellar filament capping protein FliD [Arthrobacter sp. CAU 1506]TJY71509.1 flagellar hook-associated protein [Arthrobacter sp. CAU 1506]
MAFSIGGLVSGLETATMINQLMQLEARPQTLLKNKVAGTQTLVSALQALNTRVADLGKVAAETAKPRALDIYTGTSTSEKVTVTTAEGASAGGLDLEVVQLAKAQVSVSALLSDWPESANILTIALQDGREIDVDTAGKNLDQVIKAVNDSGAGVVATKVSVGTDPANPQYRLQFASKATGAAQEFSVSLGAERFDTLEVSKAQDAEVLIWGGIQSIKSASNTFTDLLPGISVALAADTPVGEKTSITVTRDEEAVTAKAKALVDGLTDLFAFIAKNSSVTVSTSTGSTTAKGGIFTGDSSVRDIEQRMLTATISPIDGRSPSEIGISITKEGAIEFDAEKFGKAMKEDSAWAEKVVQTIAGRVETVAKEASDQYDGAITQRIQGQESLVKTLNDQVTEWDTRLAMRRSTLERTWAQLEVTLNSLQSQGDWLSSQLATLPAWGSNKK